MKRIKQDPEEGTTYNIPNTNKYDNDNKNKNSQRDLHTSTQQRKIQRKKYIFDDRVHQLKKFKEQYGHCDVTRKYDIGLNKWCDNVRYTYKNLNKGENAFRPVVLNPTRIKVLKELGFDFKSKRERNKANLQISLYEDLGEDDDDEDLDEDDDEEKMIPILSFDDRIKALKEFKEKYGHLDVPWKSDRSLYAWCSSMRSAYKRMQNGEPSNCGLTNERIQILKDLGFDFRCYIDRNVSSQDHSTPSSSQKSDRDKRKKINLFDPVFEVHFKRLKKFKEKYGHCYVPRDYRKSLYNWCSDMRLACQAVLNGPPRRCYDTPLRRIDSLRAIGFDFKSEVPMRPQKVSNSVYSNQTSSKQRIKSELDTRATSSATRPGSHVFDGPRLTYEKEDDGNNDEDEDEDHKNDSNDEEKMIPVQSFDDRIKALKEFKEKYGHLDVPWKSDRSLYLWCSSMRSGYKRMQSGRRSNCGLTNERIQILKDLGFDFRSSKERSNPSSSDDTSQKGDTSKEKVLSFDIYFDELKKFKEKYGHCEVTRKFSASLSTWCYHMRSAYKSLARSKPNSLLNPERVRLLEDVGFDFKYDGLISSNSILAFPQRRKRKQPNSAYSNQTSSNQRIKSELDISTTGSAVRPGSPAFDLSRFTYEELLQQAEENKAMCQRMEMKAKIRCKKSLTEIESSIFNTDEEDNSKGTFECRFCGLKFNFQCVCILHMPKCKAKTLNDPVWIQKHES